MNQSQERRLRRCASKLRHWARRPFFQNNNGGFNRVIAELRNDPRPIRPAPTHILRALHLQPADVRVVILGKDPYPDNNLATGLAFAVPNNTPTCNLPASLRNIFCELCLDVGYHSNNTTYDLRSWHRQGVMLLNTTLTIPDPNTPGTINHTQIGWHVLVEDVIDQLIPYNVFFIFLGAAAQRMIPPNLRMQANRWIATRHPSRPDISRTSLQPFFGSKPFSGANNFLHTNNVPPIIW